MERVNNLCLEMVNMVAQSATSLPISYELMHKYGRTYTQKAKVKAAFDRQCFKNALLYSIENNLIYVEGLAMPKGLIPLSHAWCVDEAGVIHDPTWDHGVHYLGVPFRSEFVVEVTSEAGYYGVFENLYLLKGTVDDVRKLLTDNVMT